jgi:hypothetical protein
MRAVAIKKGRSREKAADFQEMGTLRCDGCGEEFFISHEAGFATRRSPKSRHFGSKGPCRRARAPACGCSRRSAFWQNKGPGLTLHIHLIDLEKALLTGAIAVLFTVAAPCQMAPSIPTLPSTDSSIAPTLQVSALRMDPSPQGGGASGIAAEPEPKSRFMTRMLRRGLEDQKELYGAPFKPSNIKWDALVLAGTGVFLATDRRIEKHLPDDHFQLYQNGSNIALGGLAASLAGVWIYGIKTENPHARETGELELETLTNTFLIYAPMQFIAGRQRPGEGNGNGDFWRHHSMNTSFPGGHAMFIWSMATVVAHEYPKFWVRALAYGAATTVTASRFLARDHWASDMFVGSALGFAIGTHIFHSRCDPELSLSCHHHTRKGDQP